MGVTTVVISIPTEIVLDQTNPSTSTADASFTISDWTISTDTIDMSNISILTEQYTDFGLDFTLTAKEGGAVNLSIASFSLDLAGSADISVALTGQ